MAMLGPPLPISLRLATEADEALLLRWANEDQNPQAERQRLRCTGASCRTTIDHLALTRDAGYPVPREHLAGDLADDAAMV